MRRNVIYERAQFNQQNQFSDEPADRFITEVHKLAENCEFGPMKEELIRDRLVVRIRDLSLSERLQLEPDLTLDKTKRLIHQREAVELQQDILQKPKMKELLLEAVRQKPVSYQLCHKLQPDHHLTTAVDVAQQLTPKSHVPPEMLPASGVIDEAILAHYVCPTLLHWLQPNQSNRKQVHNNRTKK